MAIPLTTFEGYLRRINPEDQEQLATTALRVAFPRFASLDELLPGVPNHPKPNRRYAGDGTMTRGCYYSIGHETDGNDFGTLANELRAYCDTRATGGVEIDDLVFPQWVSKIQDPGARLLFAESSMALPGVGRHPFVVCFIKRRRPGSEAKSFLRNIIDSEISKGMYQSNILGALRTAVFSDGSTLEVEVNAVYVYYDTVRETIEHVLDLRTKPAQDWLVGLVHSGELGFDLPLHAGASAFPSLLPYLISAELGGPVVTDQIGLFLRSHHIAALVYPSARSDSFLRIRHASTEEWRYWNLLDYRPAPPTRFIPRTYAQPQFELPCSVRVELPSDGEFAGSFRVSGICASQTASLDRWLDQRMD